MGLANPPGGAPPRACCRRRFANPRIRLGVDQLQRPPAKSRSEVQISASTLEASAAHGHPSPIHCGLELPPCEPFVRSRKGISAATGTTVISAANPSTISRSSGCFMPSAMRVRASWTARSVVPKRARRAASKRAPELLPRAAATNMAASTTGVEDGPSRYPRPA